MKHNKLKSYALLLIALVLPAFSMQAFDGLKIHLTSGTSEQIELDKIQRITFDNMAMSVKTDDGLTTMFIFEDFLKITFEKMGDQDPNFNNPVMCDSDLFVFLHSGELVAVSNTEIHSMILFSIEGRIIQKTNADRMYVGTLPASVYLLQINTEQGSFMRKIIKQ